MIMNFRHKGLRDLFLLGKTSGVIPTQVKRLRHRLAVIDAACCLADIDMPGYRLHPLSGDRDGTGESHLNSSMAMHTYWITRTITDENGQSSPPGGHYSGITGRT